MSRASHPVPGGVEDLRKALAALREIDQVASGGRPAFLANRERQRAAAYLWIVVGSALKEYCRARGIARSSSVFAAPIGLRQKLAYGAPGLLDAAIVWNSCAYDAPLLLADIENVLGAL